MNRLKLAIVSTHPIQYYAPVFRLLADSPRVQPRVFFTWSQTADAPVPDRDFGASIAWNVPLRDGYEHEFVPNAAREPTSARFSGIRNPTLIAEIERWGADAVLIYGWNLRSHLAAMRHFKGRIPVLFRGDSTLLDPVGRMRAFARRSWLKWVYSHIDVALAVGSNNRDYFAWAGVPRERIVLAPHSVDTERFRDPEGAQAARAAGWRAELGIPEQEPAIVFAAKLIPKKDPFLLLDAFAGLKTPAHLVMAGSGALEPALRARALEVERVHFLPFQNQAEMPAVYRIGDVFAMSSRGPGESWGLALNEAMASGRPVIASTRTGGARDLVRTGVTGWMFEAGSGTALRRVLETALPMGRDRLARMGREAQTESRRWSSEVAAEAIVGATLLACSGDHWHAAADPV